MFASPSDLADPPTESFPEPRTLTVYLRADDRPGGVHRVPSDSTLRELIEAAGGRIRPTEPKTGVNITWPASSRERPRTKSRPDPATPSPRININLADAAELRRLPGIGTVKARRILRYRAQNGPFRGLEDLKQVRGIGETTADKLKPLIRF